MKAIRSVTFFGYSSFKSTEPEFKAARRAAREVALTGRRVVNGGGSGIMLAATLGAREARGKTTVVYYNPELATAFEGEAAANYANKSYKESNYILRTKRLLELGNAYVVFNGGTGTMSEFAMAWGLARLYFGHNKPMILYGKFWKHLMKDFKDHMKIRPRQFKVYKIVNSPKAVVKALEHYEKIIKRNRHIHPHKLCKDAECSLLV